MAKNGVINVRVIVDIEAETLLPMLRGVKWLLDSAGEPPRAGDSADMTVNGNAVEDIRRAWNGLPQVVREQV